MKKLFLVLIIAILPSVGFSDTDCVGKVNLVGTNKDGNLIVRGPGGIEPVLLCNVDTKTGSISPTACKSMQSTLLAAYASQENVLISFTPPVTSCSSI